MKKMKKAEYRRKTDQVYKRLENILKRHGVVKLRIKDRFRGDTFDGDKEYGTRLLYKTGVCKISYAPESRGYYMSDAQYRANLRKYRRKYQTSCFFEGCLEDKFDVRLYMKKGEIKISVKDILKDMREHDGSNLYIAEAQYGKYFRSRMRLPW